MDKKNEEEEKLGKLMDKFHKELTGEMKGRPYLLVVTSGYELGKEGELSKFAAQWSWRSNVFINRDEGKRLMEFLAIQLTDVVEHGENGVRKQYKLK